MEEALDESDENVEPENSNDPPTLPWPSELRVALFDVGSMVQILIHAMDFNMETYYSMALHIPNSQYYVHLYIFINQLWIYKYKH